jgi:hypothetical protein
MGAINTIMKELHDVRREVFKREDRDKVKLVIYYGRMAEMEIRSDPEIMSMLRFNNGPNIMPNRLMDALLQTDYGLPEYAVTIHVNGKPYTTFSVEPVTP